MKILIAGDYVATKRIKTLVESSDFSFFKEIPHLTSNHDLNIINLEAPVVSSESEPLKKWGPNLRVHPFVIDSLKYAGFNMVTLANNHIMDYGKEGLKETLDLCKFQQINTVGVGKDLNEAKMIKYFKKNNTKVAIINCCEHEFSIADDNTPGTCPIHPIIQYHQIKEARENADYVIVIVHGGHERHQYPSSRMIETYRFYIDIGADAIINHHQHCFSGYETYHNKPIFYGIGNFCFDKGPNLGTWNEGYMVSLNLNDKISYSIIPYIQNDTEPSIKLLPEKAFESKIKEINQIINNKELLENINNKFYNQNKNNILQIFEPYRGKILNKLYQRGILPSFIKGYNQKRIENYINCESHRDIIIHLIKQESQSYK